MFSNTGGEGDECLVTPVRTDACLVTPVGRGRLGHMPCFVYVFIITIL